MKQIIDRNSQEQEMVHNERGPYKLVRPAQSKDDTFQVREFIIIAEQNDTLTAYTWNGTTAGSREYTLTKPWLLRRTPFDEETRNGISYSYSSKNERVASKSGEDDENQVISPEYVANDIVTAEIGLTDFDGWLARSDGRAWSQVES